MGAVITAEETDRLQAAVAPVDGRACEAQGAARRGRGPVACTTIALPLESGCRPSWWPSMAGRHLYDLHGENEEILGSFVQINA